LLGEDKLRAELNDLTKRFKIRRTLTRKKKIWRRVFAQIVPEITYKPLVPVSGRVRAGCEVMLKAGVSKKVQFDSYVVIWIHGKRGRPARWSIALIPQGQQFDWRGVRQYMIKTDGLFYSP
jgi:hypothetical protein